ncbi:MAG: pirin family protein [Alphaproteobacteria bacterium]|nr:pirin family protein [Alphaproteobacteria bacterium]
MNDRTGLPDSVDLLIEPRSRDLGGFTVGRVLPYAKRRLVGPFIFFDVMGPSRFAPGEGVDVRPHPHIGLATVTYLFEGELRHRDNLGCDQVIRPGDVNWMTAGRGIVHSERTDDAPRAAGQRLYGIQTWVALPASDEETAPSFHHHPAADLPTIERDGATYTLIAGAAFGAVSPVRTFSPIYYAAVDADAGAPIDPVAEHVERAIYVVDGPVEIDGTRIPENTMAVLKSGASPKIRATEMSRLMLLGGANIGERKIWWNLVATDEAKINAARKRWADAAASGFEEAGDFALPPGETEHIPLPDGP